MLVSKGWSNSKENTAKWVCTKIAFLNELGDQAGAARRIFLLGSYDYLWSLRGFVRNSVVMEK